MKYRDYTWLHVPPEQHHSGHDEGYYYNWCPTCSDRTCHETDSCCVCGRVNEDEDEDQINNDY